MLIFHGDNTILSRQQYLNIKSLSQKAGNQNIEIDGQDLSLSDLKSVLGTSSLFGETSSIFIENLFSRRPSSSKEEIIKYLAVHTSSDINIWESKDVAVQLKEFLPANIRHFPLPKYIFEFLDTFSLSSFHKSISVAPVEQVFASLITRVHKNLISSPTPANIKQTQSLLDIDYAQKTSRSPYDLQTALELWLVNL